MPVSSDIFALALRQRAYAYAPYSRFRVGVILVCDDGREIAGNNVENASYGCTLCAERSAIVAAVAKGYTHFSRLAIAGGLTDEEAKTVPCSPCGACLQVLAEFCDGDFPIILADGVHLLCDFLPNRFVLPKGE